MAVSPTGLAIPVLPAQSAQPSAVTRSPSSSPATESSNHRELSADTCGEQPEKPPSSAGKGQKSIRELKLAAMQHLVEKIKNTDWQTVTEQMHHQGYAIVPRLLTDEQCNALKALYDHQSDRYRKSVVMARHRFGLGEYKYFSYPLPEVIQTLRTHIYPYLAPIADRKR